jgi:hypothetical protein
MQNKTSFQDHFDTSSIAIIIITVVLFIAACYLKGLTHEILLEAAVFLVSVKLIQLSYKSSVNAKEVDKKLDSILSQLGKNPESK